MVVNLIIKFYRPVHFKKLCKKRPFLDLVVSGVNLHRTLYFGSRDFREAS